MKLEEKAILKEKIRFDDFKTSASKNRKL